jgi:hypothetical protein
MCGKVIAFAALAANGERRHSDPGGDRCADRGSNRRQHADGRPSDGQSVLARRALIQQQSRTGVTCATRRGMFGWGVAASPAIVRPDRSAPARTCQTRRVGIRAGRRWATCCSLPWRAEIACGYISRGSTLPGSIGRSEMRCNLIIARGCWPAGRSSVAPLMASAC